MTRLLVLALSAVVIAAGAVWPILADATPPPTPRPWGLPVHLQTDADLRIEACESMAPVIGTRPTPLDGCRPWQACRACEPGRAEVGQVFILWPSVFRYRLYRPDGTLTPEPTGTPGVPCEPRFVVVVVTATPSTTPRPTETMESTPTAVPTRALYWPLVTQRRPRR